ncbi:MAG: hypothetical protein M1825_004196 [Sarcosagium campestre]|nr:MAG: hypothetical protein M1825_004196 [Sarcosagium campestre]
MKILETQSAHMTNYEVLQHLESMRTRYKTIAFQRGSPASMKSGNLETIVKEGSSVLKLTDYLHTPPSPLTPSLPYTSTTIRSLFTALEPYELTKAELLMILNLRPESPGVLDTIIEEMEERFADGQDVEILRIIGDVLGRSVPEYSADSEPMAVDEAAEDNPQVVEAEEQPEVAQTNGHSNNPNLHPDRIKLMTDQEEQATRNESVVPQEDQTQSTSGQRRGRRRI